jgi:hypothetical protein
MHIDLMAYADDYTASGEILLRGERLADHLNAADELRVEGVTVRALEDGREHNLPFAVINREELCVVAATGPRGSPKLRFRTRPYPMRVQVGPYAVAGYLHALPTADPFVVLQRRQIIALSPARLAFQMAGERVDERHEGLLLMRAKLALFESASDEDVGLTRAVDFSASVDPNAKDFTGAVRDHELDE